MFYPSLPEPLRLFTFCNTSTEGGDQQIFALKNPILMILVVENSNDSLLFIDTKKVPVTPQLISQWRFNDVRVTKKPDFIYFG